MSAFGATQIVPALITIRFDFSNLEQVVANILARLQGLAPNTAAPIAEAELPGADASAPKTPAAHSPAVEQSASLAPRTRRGRPSKASKEAAAPAAVATSEAPATLAGPTPPAAPEAQPLIPGFDDAPVSAPADDSAPVTEEDIAAFKKEVMASTVRLKPQVFMPHYEAVRVQYGKRDFKTFTRGELAAFRKALAERIPAA